MHTIDFVFAYFNLVTFQIALRPVNKKHRGKKNVRQELKREIRNKNIGRKKQFGGCD